MSESSENFEEARRDLVDPVELRGAIQEAVERLMKDLPPELRRLLDGQDDELSRRAAPDALRKLLAAAVKDGAQIGEFITTEPENSVFPEEPISTTPPGANEPQNEGAGASIHYLFEEHTEDSTDTTNTGEKS